MIQPRDQEAIKGDKGKGRGKRLGGPCWMCGGHTSRESAPTCNLGKMRTAVSHHHGVDIVATRKSSRTDSSTMELFASQTVQRKKGKGKSRGKRKGRRGDKGKERDTSLDLVRIHLGDRQLATCRTGTLVPLCTTVRAHCNRRGRARLEDGDRPKRDQRTHSDADHHEGGELWRNEIRRARGDDEQ